MNTRDIRILVISLVLACLGAACITGLTGCSTPPSERVVQYQTLRASGTAANAAIRGAAKLLADGHITAEQWKVVADFYDHKWQPSYAVAVAAAQYDLSTISSPDVATLLNQLLALTAGLTKP